MQKILVLTCGIILSAAALAATSSAIAMGNDANDQVTIKNIGEPKKCVRIFNIQSTKVIDNKTIDFKMRGGKILRNTLPRKCSGLRFRESFSYRATTGRLCDIDIIRVLEQRAGSLDTGAACGLGKFQEIEKIKPEE